MSSNVWRLTNVGVVLGAVAFSAFLVVMLLGMDIVLGNGSVARLVFGITEKIDASMFKLGGAASE